MNVFPPSNRLGLYDSGESSSFLLFEPAVDAVVNGELTALRALLLANPELVHARSARLHRATLLHYLGANGFENHRQKSAANAVEIARILLEAGADSNALANIYGQSTTLSLVASSIHPQKAGLQIGLIEALLDYGANINGIAGSQNPLLAALHNGRGKAAEYLAQRGARLDLEGAAGVGFREVVESFFQPDGSLKASATRAQMQAGFLWACEYGHLAVMRLLLQKGVELDTKGATGLTGLHWAVVGGHLPSVELLLQLGAGLEVRNVHGATVLGQALWSAANREPECDYAAILKLLVEAGAKPD